MPLAALLLNLILTTSVVTPSAQNTLTVDSRLANTPTIDGNPTDTYTLGLS